MYEELEEQAVTKMKKQKDTKWSFKIMESATLNDRVNSLQLLIETHPQRTL